MYTLLAPARPAAKGKLFIFVPEAKIVKREDVIRWSWRWSNSRDVAVSEKAEACKFSAITIWLASRSKLNNPNHDFKASPTSNGWAKAFELDSIVLQFRKIKLILNSQSLAKLTQRKIQPSKILIQTKKLSIKKIFFSRRNVILYVVNISYLFSETKPLRWVKY